MRVETPSLFSMLKSLFEILMDHYKDDLSMRLKYFSVLASMLKVCAETKVALNAREDISTFNLAEAWGGVYDEISKFETDENLLNMVKSKFDFYSNGIKDLRPEVLPIHVDEVIRELLRELDHMSWRNRRAY